MDKETKFTSFITAMIPLGFQVVLFIKYFLSEEIRDTSEIIKTTLLFIIVYIFIGRILVAMAEYLQIAFNLVSGSIDKSDEVRFAEWKFLGRVWLTVLPPIALVVFVFSLVALLFIIIFKLIS